MQNGMFKEVKPVATAASSLERSRIEKAAVDAGFDLTPELSDGWLVFRSSSFPVQVAIQTRQDSYDLGVSTENVGSRLSAELEVPMAIHPAPWNVRLNGISSYMKLHYALQRGADCTSSKWQSVIRVPSKGQADAGLD